MPKVLNMLLTITKARDPSDSFTNTTATITEDGQESGDCNSTIGKPRKFPKAILVNSDPKV
jgi:hypothetical protein